MKNSVFDLVIDSRDFTNDQSQFARFGPWPNPDNQRWAMSALWDFLIDTDIMNCLRLSWFFTFIALYYWEYILVMSYVLVWETGCVDCIRGVMWHNPVSARLCPWTVQVLSCTTHVAYAHSSAHCFSFSVFFCFHISCYGLFLLVDEIAGCNVAYLLMLFFFI